MQTVIHGVMPETRYQFKVWIKTDGAVACIKIGYTTAEDKWIGKSLSVEGGGGQTVWMGISKIITTPANCRIIKIMPSTWVPNYGEVWFDDISFVKLPLSVDI